MDPAIGLLLSSAFALLFAHAAWHKWRSPSRFAALLGAYRLLPMPLVAIGGYAVPLAETAIAVALCAPPARSAAAFAGALLLGLYAAAIAINLRRGRRDLDCGCTGPADRRPIAEWMVWRNVLLAPALLVTGREWSARPLEATDALTVAAGLIAVAVVYVTVDRLLGQVMPRTAAIRRGL